MPIAFDPDTRVPFWLASDADKPKETRPTFECIAPTRRQMIQYAKLKEEAIAETNDDAFFEKLIDAVLFGVKGWKNMPTPFSRDALYDLTDDELLELFHGWPRASRLTETDLKNSRSQLPADAASSTSTTPTVAA